MIFRINFIFTGCITEEKINLSNSVNDNLEIFRREFLNANTWAQRKEGVPIELLDKLTADELKIAEEELIKSARTGDSWPIIGLGHIKSEKSLEILYKLLSKSKTGIKVIIACSIYKICRDPEMIEIALEETPKITNWQELIDILYMLPDFKNERTDNMLNNFREHQDYLVAYNAARALGLSTDDVVSKFRNKKSGNVITGSDITAPEPKLTMLQKFLKFINGKN